MQGVLPGEYQVIWRMMKTVPGNVGHQQSPVQCSADAQLVHQGNTAAEATNNSSLHSMQHFNSLPTGQWVDIPGGDVLVEACAHIHVRMWSHSSEWKTGLIWDNVKLQDVNQPASLPAEGSREPDAQSTVQRAPNAFEALLGTVEDRCRLQ